MYKRQVKHTNDTASMTIAANGAVTFNQALSLPDNTVETADVQDNAITLAKMAGLARGSIIYGNANGDPTALAVGTGVLTGNGTDISYAAAAGDGVPTGTVIYHAASTAPSNFLKANGAAVSRSTYSALFTAIGTTFGVGDGSSTFNVPDLRGEFMRGWDDSRGVDGSRAFGSAQADQMEQHNHIGSNVPLHQGFGGGSGAIVVRAPADVQYGNLSSILVNRGGTTNSSENRPRNIALLACIKF